MREVDDAAVEPSRVYVNARDIARQSGDLLHPIEPGRFAWSDCPWSLDDLCQGVPDQT